MTPECDRKGKLIVHGSHFMPERKLKLTESLVLRHVSDPIWDGYGKAIRRIERLSDKRLWQLREALEALGTGNIGWLTYRVRDDLKQHVEWLIKQREVERARK